MSTVWSSICDQSARKLLARLVDLFGSAKAVDEAVSRINSSAPRAKQW